MLIGKTLRLFLDSIGRRDEYEFYLNRFAHSDTPAFAIVYPEDDCLLEAVDVLQFDLSFLMRLELVPVVLSSPAPFACIGEPHRQGFACLEWMEPLDLTAIGAFIRRQAEQHLIPVLLDRHPMPIDALALMPGIARRFHWVRAQGPLRSRAGEQLPYYYTRRRNLQELAAEDRAVFDPCRQLVEQRDGLHVSITSPIQLLRELFTVRGAGTVVRRGARFITTDRLTLEQRGRVLQLLRESFSREIADAAFLSSVDEFLFEETFQAAALMERQAVGGYLSKFAVGAGARGEGVAQELWQELTDRYPQLFWRAREQNPIAHWYAKQADGRHRAGGWVIFWKGIEFNHIPQVIDFCIRRSDDFQPPPLGDPPPPR